LTLRETYALGSTAICRT